MPPAYLAVHQFIASSCVWVGSFATTAPTVRKVIKDGIGWWVQGQTQNEVVLRRSRGPEDQTPPEMVGEAPRKRDRR